MSLEPAQPYGPEFCEREYNARAAVPAHKDFFLRWAARSAAARSRLSGYLDFPYGAGELQTLDLFPAADPRGLLAFIHGGYWRSLDKSDFSFVAEPFVERGISVASINYSLCPAVGVDAIVDEVTRAVAWLHAQAGRFGLKDKPIVVAGHSAGGHLAAMMLTRDWAAYGVAAPAIAGAVGISGIYELEPLLHASMNGDLRLDRETLDRVSTARLAPTVRVPLHLVAGAVESSEFRRQGRLLAAAWPELVKSCAEAPGEDHFSIVEHFADPDSPAFRATLALFD